MEEVKKELVELKEIVSKLLILQTKDYNMKYGYLSGKTNHFHPND